MDAEILFVKQELEHGVGERADAQLHGRAIGDQLGDMGRDFFDHCLVNIVPHRHFKEGSVNRHDVMHLVDVHGSVAQCARHLFVDLGNHHPGDLCSGDGEAGFRAHGTEAVYVRRRDVDQGHIQGEMAVLEEQGEFGEHHRGEVGPPLVDRPAHIGADEHGIDAQMPVHFEGRHNPPDRWSADGRLPHSAIAAPV